LRRSLVVSAQVVLAQGRILIDVARMHLVLSQ
jgi:hypothetical protein